MPVPHITLGAVNLEAANPESLASFWAAVTGGNPVSADGSVYLPPAEPGALAMFFQPLTGSRPDRQTIHLDLTVPWGARRSEVDRLVLLGATARWDVLDEHPHVQWTTMADPEGNLFCVAEHPPQS
jgi:hypothetical protein